MIINHLGEGLSLLAPIIWAGAVILFRKSGERTDSVTLNLLKNILALVFFIPTIYLAGQTLFYPAPVQIYILLGLSGALGIGLGDTLFFKSLNRLGAGLAAIVTPINSIFIIIISMVFLGERMTWWQIGGTMIIIGAILSTTKIDQLKSIDKKNIIQGLIWGVLAQLSNAVAVVMIKSVLDSSPVLWLTTVRLIAGTIVLLIIRQWWLRPGKIVTNGSIRSWWIITVAGSFLGGYLSMMLWLMGMKWTQASVASVLNQTGNVFIFVLAWIFLKERISTGRVAALMLTVLGALMVALG